MYVRVVGSVAYSLPGQELKEAYFSEMNTAATSAAKPEAKDDKPSVGTKKKPVPKKKVQEDDPFASEGEADAEEAGRKQAVKTAKKSGKRSQPSDVEADAGADDSDRPKPKKMKGAR